MRPVGQGWALCRLGKAGMLEEGSRFVRHRTKAVSTSLNYIGSTRFKVHPRRIDETQADMNEC